MSPSDNNVSPSYCTLGLGFARSRKKTKHFPILPKDFVSAAAWHPSALKYIKLVSGCHLILHQCFSAFQTNQILGLYRFWSRYKFSLYFTPYVLPKVVIPQPLPSQPPPPQKKKRERVLWKETSGHRLLDWSVKIISLELHFLP